ncbi:MAG: SCO family protein [Gammaproteobacteria bacterium]|nr:SCO family protein [Gammaproteobacteria bacterium]MBU1440906.1 SCO family protein [Gammaproteobacteria bacterium]MBU2288338.1 SCO family protein [Gammaproteobacteria bacterium]MBU2410055.1 SCO family protein [Gammaproteobacteria bacterium]
MTPQTAPLVSRRALCLGTAALALALARHEARAAGSPVWLPAPVLPDVALQDQDGRSVRLQRDLIAGHTVIVNFMFAGCQTVCPPQTALLRDAVRRLAALRPPRDLRVLSITVDPMADGPAQLRAFGERYALPMVRPATNDISWTLLTGPPGDIARVLGAFDVPAAAPGEHPGLLWLGDAARGRWTRTSSLNPPETLVSLVEALRQ